MIKGQGAVDQLSREKAEKLILNKDVVHSKIEQDKNEMRIYLELGDGQCFLVKYDRLQKSKTYFLEHPSTHKNSPDNF